MKNALVLVLSFVAILISGCATTSWQETKAALSPEQLEVFEAAKKFHVAQNRSFEEFDNVTTSDLIVKSSYLNCRSYIYESAQLCFKDGSFVDKMTYWKAYNAKKKGDLKNRSQTPRNLRIDIVEVNSALLSYTLDTLQFGGGERTWKGSVNFIFKLRREDGVWKVYYYEIFPN